MGSRKLKNKKLKKIKKLKNQKQYQKAKAFLVFVLYFTNFLSWETDQLETSTKSNTLSDRGGDGGGNQIKDSEDSSSYQTKGNNIADGHRFRRQYGGDNANHETFKGILYETNNKFLGIKGVIHILL
jgi:hypothetical protein